MEANGQFTSRLLQRPPLRLSDQDMWKNHYGDEQGPGHLTSELTNQQAAIFGGNDQWVHIPKYRSTLIQRQVQIIPL
ncbi:hypothetical protein KSX_01080 [Ktedonospora formicarum]|uniref:Uncharacterized protein n=1 Tax=Ktedonospora formicarum TaxID=2778364 RepID=A0A8J3MR47_9CHLR|nr:hypothetical protein KSX_01080 [Ktedonospora formicarum]